MYTLKSIFCSLLLLFSSTLNAQKKDAVGDLPYSNKTEVSEQVLESFFQSSGNISIDLAPEFRLEGTLQNKSSHGDSIISLLISVLNRPGSMLSLTRYKNSNGNISYAGNLLRLHDHEGWILIEKDQHYYFLETQQKFLVTE
jgi:hypothetical protein